MSPHLRQVGLEFLDSAPLRWAFEAELAAAPPEVFGEVGAVAAWPWFPGLSGERYVGSQPYGVGTRREIRMVGVPYRETILAWDEPTRWAFRVDACGVPMAHALVEDWRFEPRGDASLVRWTFAVDPSAMFRTSRRLAQPVMSHLFRRAMRNLERRLGAGAGILPGE